VLVQNELPSILEIQQQTPLQKKASLTVSMLIFCNAIARQNGKGEMEHFLLWINWLTEKNPEVFTR
jgi:hypothetical protein